MVSVITMVHGIFMTTLKDLNELAKECEVCAMKDQRSINTHLNECNTCGEYFEKADSFKEDLKEIRGVTIKPDSSIHRDLNERMSKIANMDSKKRKVALKGLLDTISILSEEDRVKFVRTRTDIITGFDKIERDPILTTLSYVMKDWDKERKRIEKNSLMKATDDYPVLKKMMVRNMFNDMLEMK